MLMLRAIVTIFFMLESNCLFFVYSKVDYVFGWLRVLIVCGAVFYVRVFQLGVVCGNL